MLEVISELLQIFLDMVPRLRRIDSTHGAVSVYFGRWRRVLGPGTHFYWPIIQEFQEENTLERNSETAIFGATTEDGFTFQCRLAIRWEISDLIDFQFGSSCGQTFLEQSAQCAATAIIGDTTTAGLMVRGAGQLSEGIIESIELDCNERGITLHDVQFNLLSMAIPVLHAYAEQTSVD